MNDYLNQISYTAAIDERAIESRIKQLSDSTVSHNDEDLERVADAYAKSKTDILTEKKKAMLEAGTAKSKSEEYAEYKTAYDTYHAKNRIMQRMGKVTKQTR